MPFGYHLMLDMYRCQGEALASIEACYRFLDDLAELLRMSKQSPPFLFRSDGEKYPDKAGLSGWLPLIESGIQIHTVEPACFASLDIYSCRDYDRDAAARFAADIFRPEEIETNFILRGTLYDQEMTALECTRNR